MEENDVTIDDAELVFNKISGEDHGSAQEAGEDQADQGQQENLILGKFRSPEDVIKAYENLEPELGRLRNEIGELRRREEQMRQYLALQQQSSQQGQSQHPSQPGVLSEDALERMFERNPEQALDIAAQQGNIDFYQRAYSEWHEIDPLSADNYLVNRKLLAFQNYLQSQLASTIGPMVEHRERELFSSVCDRLNEQTGGDLARYQERMIELARANPAIGASLSVDDPSSIENTVKYLYFAAKGMDAQSAPPPQAPPPQQQQQGYGYVMPPTNNMGQSSSGELDPIKRAILEYNSTIAPPKVEY